MRFSCEKCGAVYRIADEKLAGRSRPVVTCKHCKNKIRLVLPAATAPAAVAPAPASAAPAPREVTPAAATPFPVPPADPGGKPALSSLVGGEGKDPAAQALAEWAAVEALQHIAEGPGRKAPPAADPFARVPDAPTIVKSSVDEMSDVTRSIIARAGVKRSPWPLVAAAGVLGAVVVALALALRGAPAPAFAPRGPAPAESPSTMPAPKSAEPASPPPTRPPPAPREIERLGGDASRPVRAAAPEGGASGRTEGASPPAGTLRPPEGARRTAPKLSAADADELAALYGDTSRKEHEFKLPGEATPQLDTTAAALDPATIARVITNYMPSLQGCVDAEYRRRPDFKGGKVRITATVRASGTVGSAVLDSRIIDGTALGECLKDRARRMVFPAFSGEPFDVEIPIVMGAGG